MARTADYARVLDGGRIVIPASIRKELGLRTGDKLILECVDGELRLRSRLAGIRRAQALARKYVEGTPSMADELIRERRAEAAAE